jgi:precorrin-6Y C5,15-methyltransferase (decarboxylating)
VVLASGDPLFFGIGSILIKALGADNVTVYPNISSIAAAFARIKEPWSRVRVVSLHGRQNDAAVIKALNGGHTVAALTDPGHSPAWIAKRLIMEEVVNTRMCVLEALGTKNEKFNWYGLDQASEMTFSEPNLVILKPGCMAHPRRKRLHLGIPDRYFLHESGLITKSEIRAISLAKLRLLPNQVLWDLGAGSGSVSIEASLLIGDGTVIAVEQKTGRVRQIEANMDQFGITNMQVVQAVLPEGLAGLPRPDRVFIGGGGQQLNSIIESAASCLTADGVVVINTVLLPNVVTARETLDALGFRTSVVQVQVSQSRKMPWAERMEARNPVWIISGSRIAN